ncbi:hypothetical protein RR46_10158 [Papilio xuthus]|uniref:Uncharacterized protein n=1 Tax=Papilio xuthus TaxID=66420 RepID=A0A194Q607_PAPXU|nr:hypothetical protein RR46_10158 [Papilio xuthus]
MSGGNIDVINDTHHRSATPEELQMRCRPLRKWYVRFLKDPKLRLMPRYGTVERYVVQPSHKAAVRGKKLRENRTVRY